MQTHRTGTAGEPQGRCRVYIFSMLTARVGWQKGSVEALVKFVKGDFFTQRRFGDVDQDLPA